jgi:hypothetical protein
MWYANAAKYRENERRWREQASRLPAGVEQNSCLALAGGYADLLAIIERLEVPGHDGATVTVPSVEFGAL